MTIAEKGDVVLTYEEACTELESSNSNRRTWPLFGGAEIGEDVLAIDNVDVFAARSAAFAGTMASPLEHFKLKEDLKEHLYDRRR